MKILFIYCEDVKNDIFQTNHDVPLNSNDQIPFGIGYLTAVLKQHGHEINLLVLTRKQMLKKTDAMIQKVHPDVICFSVVFREYANYIKIADYVKKKYSSIVLVAGGPHISLHPDEALESSLDVLCLGEGEKALTELMDKIEHGEPYEHLFNIWMKKDGKVYKNPIRPFNTELDSFPMPLREIWKPYIQHPDTPISILLGRGCYFSCTYCCNHALKKVADGQYVRYRSPENIFEEIRYLVKNYPDNDTIYFETEAMNCDKQFLNDFCTKLVQFNKTLDRTVYYGTNIRVTPNEDWNSIFKLFRKANISYVNIGLESGSERVRSEIMRRKYTNEDVLNAAKAARKHRIYTMLYVMVGLPTETREEYEMSVDMVRKCKPTVIHMGIFYPYPGTDLYKYCEEHNLCRKLKKDSGRNIASLDMPQFSRREVQKQYNLFYPRVYSKTKRERRYMYMLITLGTITGIKWFDKRAMNRLKGRTVNEEDV